MKKIILLFSLILSFSVLFAQQKSVTGRVTDESNEPLPGASVVVKGTITGTITDISGNFKILVPEDKKILSVTFIGYEPQDVNITGKSTANVKLVISSISLQEVIAVGYGSMKKSDLSGSVASVNTDKISEKSYPNFQQVLNGRAAGVVVQESSGEPGAGLSIEIRGMSSISGSSQPLYVVDGIPFEASAASGNTYGPTTVTSPLASLNPNDIAAIEVLKDASATAIYGSRGANGVVLITTKTGKEGKPRINFSYNHSLSNMNFPVERLNAVDQATAVNERNVYRAEPVAYTPEEIANLKYYDHFKEVSRTGIIQDYNVSISGGTKNTKYYISYQNFNQQGIYKGSDLNRNSFKVNIETEAIKNLTVKSMVTYNRSVNTGFPVNPGYGGGLFASANSYSPLVPMLNPDGSYNKVADYKFGSELYLDPIYGAIYYNPRFDLKTQVLPTVTQEPGNNTFVLIDKYKSSNITQQLVGNFDISYKISDHLRVNGKVGMISGQTLGETYRPRALPVEQTWKGMAYINNAQTMKLLYESTINYSNIFGKHRVNGVIGATAETFETKRFAAENREFPNDVTGYYNIGSGTVLMPPSSDYEGNQLASFLGRFNYNYADKYLVTFTGRYDGSSRFAKGNKFGFFPSVAASWRVTKEKFMENIHFLSDLKLRASYGVIGNQAVANYSTMSTLSSGMNYGFGSMVNTGYAASRVPNPNLTWEESKQANLGTDIALAGSRIRLSVDVYKKNTERLLYNAQTPLTLGFSTMTQNVGAMENKGLEVVLSTINVKGSFNWNTDFNIGFNKNKITKLTGAVQFIQNGGEIGGLTRSYLDKPIGEIYGYRTLPVWNAESLATKPATFQPGAKPGDARFEDINGSLTLDQGDLVPLGNALPIFTGGISNNFTYKGFDLNISMSFSYGAYAYNAFLAGMAGVGGNSVAYSFFDNRYRDITPEMDAVTAEKVTANNLVTRYPRSGAYSDVRTARDYYVEKTSFLRVQNITLGYNLPQVLLKRISVQNLRVFTTIQNPLIITNYTGINPEGTASNTGIGRGIDSGGYPLAKIASLGINFTF